MNNLEAFFIGYCPNISYVLNVSDYQLYRGDLTLAKKAFLKE